jgi:hypothetical protein
VNRLIHGQSVRVTLIREEAFNASECALVERVDVLIRDRAAVSIQRIDSDPERPIPGRHRFTVDPLPDDNAEQDQE